MPNRSPAYTSPAVLCVENLPLRGVAFTCPLRLTPLGRGRVHMIRWKIAVILLSLLSVSGASAAINGTLQSEFACPAKDCVSTCSGPGGNRVINNYSFLRVWVVSTPPHVLLQTETGRTIMLGSADACEFGGMATTILPPPIPPTPLNPPPGGGGKICITIPGRAPQCM